MRGFIFLLIAALIAQLVYEEKFVTIALLLGSLVFLAGYVMS